MNKFIVLASLVAASVVNHAAAATVSGRVAVVQRRGPAPTIEETVVWLEPVSAQSVKPRKPEQVQLVTRAKKLLPHVLAVPVGSTIQFPNEDPILHNLFSVSAPNDFDLGLYRRGSGKSQRFDASGIVNVYCNVHPSMSAVLHVMATPYYTMAGSDGAYRLEDVPAGRYRLWAWNELGGTSRTDITIGSGDQQAAITLDGKMQRPAQHLNKNGQPYTRSRDDY